VPNDKYCAQRSLRELLGNVEKRGELSRDQVLHVMTKSREAVEQRKLQATYPTLQLYANWCVHPEICRSELGDRVVGEVFGAFTDYLCARDDSVEAMNSFVDTVSRALRLDELLDEMRALFHELMLPDAILRHPSVWSSFRGWLLHSIAAKPLKLRPSARGAGNRDQPSGKIYTEMRKLLADHGLDDGPPNILPWVDGGLWLDTVVLPDGAEAAAVVIPFSTTSGEDIPLFKVLIAPQRQAVEGDLWPNDGCCPRPRHLRGGSRHRTM
jgi:hypothetical protein